MKPLPCTITYGETVIDYELRMMHRKSLEIAVHPDKSVVVKAPISYGIEAIKERIQKKARWIKKKIAYFNQFEPRTPARQYVGGESHLYVGRKYRLKIEKTGQDKVLLKNGYFYIECVDNQPAHIKDLLDAWYKQHAQMYLSSVFDDCWEKFKPGFKRGVLEKPVLKLKTMKRRWGSMSSRGLLTLNLRLIQAPRECIEYVLVHELCHLIHQNHSRDFYRLMDRTMPDWLRRKHKLEMSLV